MSAMKPLPLDGEDGWGCSAFPDRRAPTPDPSLKGGEKSWAAVTRIAWPVAARVLGWAPNEFWAATPAELLGALAIPGTDPASAAPLARDDMVRLMEADDG